MDSRQQTAGSALPAMFQLRSRVALVTGAAGHLGSVMATTLAEAGAHVVLNGRSEQNVAQTVASLRARGLLVSAAVFDVTRFSAAKDAVRKIGDEHGRLDILVNNAYDGTGGTLATAKVEDFENAYRVVVTAAFHLLQTATPLLREAARQNPAGASVINVSSMYGTVSPRPEIYGDSGLDNPPFYGAAKAGLVQLTRYAAVQLAPDRIRVNAISPGCFPAPRIVAAHLSFIDRLCCHIPMKRIGAPQELMGPLLFLASDASSYVTGANLPVDGGWTAW